MPPTNPPEATTTETLYDTQLRLKRALESRDKTLKCLESVTEQHINLLSEYHEYRQFAESQMTALKAQLYDLIMV